MSYPTITIYDASTDTSETREMTREEYDALVGEGWTSDEASE